MTMGQRWKRSHSPADRRGFSFAPDAGTDPEANEAQMHAKSYTGAGRRGRRSPA